MNTNRWLRLGLLVLVGSGLLVFASKSGALQAVVDMIFSGHNLPVQGKPVAATHGKLSEHVTEYIKSLPPQAQAEELMQDSINRTEGANEMIAAMLDGWHGRLQPTDHWETLYSAAVNSNDLRVRAAAIEINLVTRQLDKTQDTVNRLISNAEQDPQRKAWDAYMLGLLANRGIDTQHVHNLLREWAHDPDEGIRYWSVEGMAMIGTDDTIPDFLDVLHNDASGQIRERGGCSLAQSGMLTREQRMKAVPGLVDIAEDPGLDATTRVWVFQALREITDLDLGPDPEKWRAWYGEHGQEAMNQFHGAEQNQIVN